MRHRVKGKKLGRTKAPREAVMRGLLTSLILHESIKTTTTKARMLAAFVDRMMTHVRKDAPHQAIRVINANLYSDAASRKMMEVLKDRYKDRHSGVTRIHRLGNRVSDGAPLVRIELL